MECRYKKGRRKVAGVVGGAGNECVRTREGDMTRAVVYFTVLLLGCNLSCRLKCLGFSGSHKFCNKLYVSGPIDDKRTATILLFSFVKSYPLAIINSFNRPL
eukprot:Pompholyxophrys_punicea_v1_NODE_284_length_2390_cov_13.907066.p5 type:complete len:102 gc:universal NODE_284_length_2390_cov_13.907066:1162-857(-)